MEIHWKPDKKSKLPLYSQIVSYFSGKISNGDLIIGQKLPPQRELARIFEVNRSTIVEAMEEMTSLGMIQGNAGQGTKIINDTWSLTLKNATPDWQRYIEGGTFKANEPIVAQINKLEYDTKIIRLGTGEMSPDLFPREMNRQVLANLADKVTGLNYVEPLGLAELRESLSKYLLSKGIQAPPSCILIVSGALQALQLISACILPKRSTVYVENPSYMKSLHVFQYAGPYVEGVPMDQSGIMPWMIKSKNIDIGNSVLYTIPTFQNPTGTVMSESRRLEVLNFCQTNKMPLIEDDILGELWLDKIPPKPIKSKDKSGIVLYIGSASKCLAPGLRLGWVVAPESVIQRLADVKMQTDYGTGSLSQWAMNEWLETGLFYEALQDLRKELMKRRNFTLQILDCYFKKIATWEKPEGSYYIWVKVKGNIHTDKVFELALKENLLINPGSIYDINHTKHIRISYAYANYRELEQGLIKLAQLITKMQ